MQRVIIKKVSKLELSILCTVCLFMWVYIPTRYHPNILNSFWSYRAYTKNCEKMQREITRKVSKLELCHLCAGCLIIWIYIPIKVHPNTLNSFGVMEYTQKFVKKKYKKNLSPKNAFFTKKLGTSWKEHGITWKQRPWRNHVWNLKHAGWILCEKIRSAKGLTKTITKNPPPGQPYFNNRIFSLKNPANKSENLLLSP